jgi:hypothetical protein
MRRVEGRSGFITEKPGREQAVLFDPLFEPVQGSNDLIQCFSDYDLLRIRKMQPLLLVMQQDLIYLEFIHA